MKRLLQIAGVWVLCGVLWGGSAEAKGTSKVQVTGVVNINQASQAELDKLPGVGAKAAARIIDYRKKTPFNRPEELVKVKGFGKKRFDALKPHLTVAGPTTLKSQKVATGSAPQARSTLSAQSR